MSVSVADADYLAAFHHVFLPIAYEFAPDLIIIAAGYDAAAGDPMGGCHVSSAGFAHMTALLGAVAPLAVILEGGYNLAATAGGVEATLRVLLGERPPRLPQGPLALPCQVAMMTISHAISIQVPHSIWDCGVTCCVAGPEVVLVGAGACSSCPVPQDLPPVPPQVRWVSKGIAMKARRTRAYVPCWSCRSASFEGPELRLERQQHGG